MTTRAVLLTVIVLIAGCGGEPTGSNDNIVFSAMVDGSSWASTAAVTQATGAASGIFTIVGTSGGNTPTLMSIVLTNIGVNGTYPLGVGGTVRGGSATLTQGTTSWSTPLSGAAG